MKIQHLVTFFWLFACAALAKDPQLEHVNVYTAGDDGYKTYRIPALEIAPDGTLLAFAEGRKQSGRDPGDDKEQDVELVLKRSTDDGKTWSAMKIIEDPGRYWSAANVSTVVDRDTGKIWVVYLRCGPGLSMRASRPGTNDTQTMARFSSDNGVTWSEPIDLTAVARDMEDHDWNASATGVGGGIQTTGGRLLVPCFRHPFGVFAIYSDDHGQSWSRGELVPGSDVANESQLIELADGRIMLDMRQEKGPWRGRSISGDGGETWSELVNSQKVSRCACAIERLTLKSAGDDRNRILWTGPKGPGRITLVARLSYDEGESYPVEKVLYQPPAAYSDLVVLKDGTAGCLWERAQNPEVGNKIDNICFTRFGLSHLEPQSESNR